MICGAQTQSRTAFPILEARNKGKKVRDMEVTGVSDGSTPLTISVGQSFDVSISFDSASPSETGTFTATLLIQGDTWDPIKIPISALVAGRVVLFSPVSNNQWYHHVRQGENNVMIPVFAKLEAGPQTDVNYSLATILSATHDNILMKKKTVTVSPANPEVNSNLEFTIAPDVSVGTKEVYINFVAFNAIVNNFVVLYDFMPGNIEVALLSSNLSVRNNRPFFTVIEGAHSPTKVVPVP